MTTLGRDTLPKSMNVTPDELQALCDEYEVTQLTDEEERMIFAFREFKLKRHKAGAVFTWQTHPEIEGGEVRTALVKDVQFVNGPVRHRPGVAKDGFGCTGQNYR